MTSGYCARKVIVTFRHFQVALTRLGMEGLRCGGLLFGSAASEVSCVAFHSTSFRSIGVEGRYAMTLMSAFNLSLPSGR